MTTKRYKATDYAALMEGRTVGGRRLSDIAEAAIDAGREKNAQQKPPEPQRRAGWNKYGAKKVTTEDGVFDSQIEHKRWLELKQLQMCGLISHLERQIPFTLEVNGLKICRFTVDHKWFDVSAGEWRFEDVKGVLVRDFMLRVKLIKAIHGIDVQVWPERKPKKRRAAKK